MHLLVKYLPPAKLSPRFLSAALSRGKLVIPTQVSILQKSIILQA